MKDATASFQRVFMLRGITDLHAIAAAIAQEILDLSPQVGVIDDNLMDAGLGQGLKMIFDEALPPRLQQRFGEVIGERAHALSPSRRQDHGLHVQVGVSGRCSLLSRALTASAGCRSRCSTW